MSKINLLTASNRLVEEIPGTPLWKLTFNAESGMMRSSAHHMMVCTQPDTIRLDDLDAATENTLWTTVSACREEFRAQTGAQRMLVAVNDGPEACQSIPQIHVHILSLDIPSLKTSYADAVTRDLTCRRKTETPFAPHNLTALFTRAAYVHNAQNPAGPSHTVTAGTDEQEMWKLQRPLRHAMRAHRDGATGFSVFMESTPGQDSEIHLIARQPGLHIERGLTDIVRRHYLGLPYIVQEPVKKFLRNHPAAAQTFMRLRQSFS